MNHKTYTKRYKILSEDGSFCTVYDAGNKVVKVSKKYRSSRGQDAYINYLDKIEGKTNSMFPKIYQKIVLSSDNYVVVMEKLKPIPDDLQLKALTIISMLHSGVSRLETVTEELQEVFAVLKELRNEGFTLDLGLNNVMYRPSSDSIVITDPVYYQDHEEYDYGWVD